MVRGEVLGIVACVVLQDELLHVLSNDKELRNLFVLDDEAGRALVDRTANALPGVTVTTVPSLSGVPIDAAGFSVLLEMKITSLHRDPKMLRDEVTEAVRGMKDRVGAVLLFYGLCRNALWRIERATSDIAVPQMLLTDREGYEVDDCFGAVLGGKRSYLQYIKQNHGTMFITTGYATRWAGKLGDSDVVKATQAYSDLKFVFDACGYHRALRLDTGLGDVEKFDHQVELFARMFDMELASEKCVLDVFDLSYEHAKAAMRGIRHVKKEEEDETEPTSNPLTQI